VNGRHRTDGELMRAFARRERAAAETLYRAYAPRIYGLGLAMLGLPSAAEDLVQDTMVKAWRNAGRFDSARGSLDTWMLKMARNLAIDALRRRVLERRHVAADDEAAAEAPDPSVGPAESAEATDLLGRARAAMAGLAPEQRAVLELAYFGGRTAAEAAEIEGIPLGTAKTRIRRGLLRLRAELGEQAEADREEETAP
jgi:RNA polymerase sigma-70 factor (ECF subfamily)